MESENNNNKYSPQIICYYSYNTEDPYKPLMLDAKLQSELLNKLNILLNEYDVFTKKELKDLNPLNFNSFGAEFSKYTEDEDKFKYNIIKDIFKILKPGLNYNTKISIQDLEKLDLKINFNSIMILTNALLILLEVIFENKNDKKNLLHILSENFTWKKILQSLLNSKKKNKKIELINDVINFIESFDTIQKLYFDLNDNDIKTNLNSNFLYRILLFSYFFHTIFFSCNFIHFNMNIEELIYYYYKEEGKQKIYLMENSSLISKFDEYKNYFISYYIINQKISELLQGKKIVLSINQMDNYSLEIDNLFKKEYKNFKNLNNKDLNFIFYNGLYKLNNFWDFVLHFNSLDDQLFKNYLNICFLHLCKGNNIPSIEIDLFPKEVNKINYKKIIMNKIFYNDLDTKQIFKDFSEKKYNFNFHENIRWYNETKSFIEELKKNNIELNEEKISNLNDDLIYDYLFNDLNENLKYLIIVLEKNYNFAKVNINVSLPQFLINKKNYIYCMSYFFYNIFIMIFKKKSILDLNYLKINSNITFSDKFFENVSKIDLSNLKCQNFIIKLNSLSKFLDFNKLPLNEVSLLSLYKLNNEDFLELNNAFNQQKNLNNKSEKYFKINQLYLKFNYLEELDYNLIFNFFKDNLLKSILDIKFYITNSLIHEEYAQLIYNIVNGLAWSTELNNNLNIISYCYCDDLLSFNPIEMLYNYLYNFIKESFKYDKLSEDLIVYHNINFKKEYYIKKDKTKIEEEVIQVNMNKFVINKKIELLVKLIRYLDKNRVIKNEDSMRITTNILSFYMKPDINIMLKFKLRNNI
jgi:hypothetical protein